jgi:hypothetical protein
MSSLSDFQRWANPKPESSNDFSGPGSSIPGRNDPVLGVRRLLEAQLVLMGIKITGSPISISVAAIDAEALRRSSGRNH